MYRFGMEGFRFIMRGFNWQHWPSSNAGTLNPRASHRLRGMGQDFVHQHYLYNFFNDSVAIARNTSQPQTPKP